jgi:hypothetical protein
VLDNQLASAFVRWAPRGARAELYGEFARNDAALDVREIIAEPDHQSAYMLGARALLGGSAARLRLVRVEWVNSRVTHVHRVRPQGPFYSHTALRQGHTNRGEVLGSVAVPGGGGALVGLDTYAPDGRTSLELHRIARGARPGEGAPSPGEADVQYAATYARTRFRAGIDVTTAATAAWELNRGFRGDAFNLNVHVAVRYGRDHAPAPR